jgi:hypothetical protein
MVLKRISRQRLVDDGQPRARRLEALFFQLDPPPVQVSRQHQADAQQRERQGEKRDAVFRRCAARGQSGPPMLKGLRVRHIIKS